MISVLQRVSSASVVVDGRTIASIGLGLLVLTAVQVEDTDDDLRKTADKILTLRAFPDGDKAYHLDITQLFPPGEILLVPNFTVAADISSGRRPSLHPAAPPLVAKEMFAQLLCLLRSRHPPTQSGQFGADMQVSLTTSGPLTLLYNTRL